MKKFIIFLTFIVILSVGVFVFLSLPKAPSFSGVDRLQTSEKEKTIDFAFPRQIGSFHLVPESEFADAVECQVLGDHPDVAPGSFQGGEVCLAGMAAKYKDDSSGKGISIRITKVTKGREVYDELLWVYGQATQIGNVSVIRQEPHELSWWVSNPDDIVILTQEYTVLVPVDGSQTNFRYEMTTGEDAVTQYFLEKFPPRNL